MTTRFGDALDNALRARGWTQGQLELQTEQAGEKVEQSTISRIIRGKMSPTIEIAAAIARALEASLDAMCGITPLSLESLGPDEAEIIALARQANQNRMVIEHLRLLIEMRRVLDFGARD